MRTVPRLGGLVSSQECRTKLWLQFSQVGLILQSQMNVELLVKSEEYLNVHLETSVDRTCSKRYQLCLVPVRRTLHPGCVTELLGSV